ncbi:MAG: hypothetical protein ABSH00_04450 [Bryobacteraceae bacterium]|jgi:hypothetical protein
MRTIAALGILTLAPALGAADKLTWQDRVELARGLDFEYANVKVLLPHSRKPLEFNADGTWDKTAWAAVAKQAGPAAREGDLVQITKVTIESDRLLLDINGGFAGGRHWYSNGQIGGGPSSTPTMTPIASGDSNAKSGTCLVLLFHKPLEPMKASEVKKMLAPVLDFEKHSAAEIYAETLTPVMQAAIKDKRALEGMTRDQVVMALGRPAHKSRETTDGVELEDWVYGLPPGKITFVTFRGDKVVKVKEEYAGLGTIAREPPSQ